MGEFLTPLLQLTIAKLTGAEDKHPHMCEKSQLYQCCMEKLKFRGKPTWALLQVLTLCNDCGLRCSQYLVYNRGKEPWEERKCSESSHKGRVR